MTWNNQESAADAIISLRPNIYCKGQDYKKIKNDITKKIKIEINSIKKVNGKIVFTDDIVFSSTKIINANFNLLSPEQKKILESVRSRYSIKQIEKFFEQVKKINVGLIGEIIIDIYAFGEALGKSGKEPIMMIKNINEEKYLGGTGAIANHLSSFINKIDFYGMIGEKKENLDFIRRNLKKNVIQNFYLKNSSPTIIKKRYLGKISNTFVTFIS